MKAAVLWAAVVLTAASGIVVAATRWEAAPRGVVTVDLPGGYCGIGADDGAHRQVRLDRSSCAFYPRASLVRRTVAPWSFDARDA